MDKKPKFDVIRYTCNMDVFDSSLPHGSRNRYAKGCRCEFCGRANTLYTNMQRQFRSAEARIIEEAVATPEQEPNEDELTPEYIFDLRHSPEHRVELLRRYHETH